MNTQASTHDRGRVCRQALRSANLKALAAGLALTVGLQSVAAAQPAAQVPTAPPNGEYAPPPAGSEVAGSTYDRSAQDADRAYADQYSRWAAQYCVDKRNNEAAGAAIGGVLGAILGSGLAGRGAHVGGAVVGGALGATAGAAIGAHAKPGAACPPGYVIAPGAPAFVYAGPPLAPAVVYGPDWYQPWVWVDGRWVYRPYRYWYWDHRAYWRPDWRPGAWRYHGYRW
jgi:hypothetical protein